MEANTNNECTGRRTAQAQAMGSRYALNLIRGGAVTHPSKTPGAATRPCSRFFSCSACRSPSSFHFFFFSSQTMHQTSPVLGWLFNTRRDARYGMVLSDTLPFAAYILDVCSLICTWIHPWTQQRRYSLHIAHTDYQTTK